MFNSAYIQFSYSFNIPKAEIAFNCLLKEY